MLESLPSEYGMHRARLPPAATLTGDGGAVSLPAKWESREFFFFWSEVALIQVGHHDW